MEGEGRGGTEIGEGKDRMVLVTPTFETKVTLLVRLVRKECFEASMKLRMR